MKHISVLLPLLLVAKVLAVERDFLKGDEEHQVPFLELAAERGYPAEEHFILTADGYSLCLHRIQAQNQSNVIDDGRPVVFIQHGLMDSSASYIIRDDGLSPAQFFANHGYDVWLGNSRGNRYSRNHSWYSPNDPRFWAFSWQDMAEFDLTAAFDFVFQVTQQKINYIAHSQGTLQMFAALCQRNKVVVDNLRTFIAFAPIFYLTNEESTMFKVLARLPIAPLIKMIGIHELLDENAVLGSIAGYLCGYFPEICNFLVFSFSDTNTTIDNDKFLHAFTDYFPAGTSVQNILHFKQMIDEDNENITRKYDFGSREENIKAYGTSIPPIYDPRNIEEKVHLFVGKYDKLANKQDVKLLAQNLKSFEYREYELGHGSFTMAYNMTHLFDALAIIENRAQTCPNRGVGNYELDSEASLKP